MDNLIGISPANREMAKLVVEVLEQHGGWVEDYQLSTAVFNEIEARPAFDGDADIDEALKELVDFQHVGRFDGVDDYYIARR